ncbi:MAG: hypothetical protein AB1401_04120 [Thermodesulfobacteriota bacterium]
MLTVSKWLFIIAGALFIIESILIIAGVRTLLFGWPLPCPVAFLLLGAGLLLFAIGSNAFKKE